jgi:hypothetical protein
LIETLSKTRRPSPVTAKWQLPSPTEILRRPDPARAGDCNSASWDGRKSDESDEQLQNARTSIYARLEPESNVTVESELHSAKQASAMILTDEGTQIDESAEQLRNAESPMYES